MRTQLGNVPALDGIRAIAILYVIAFHFFGVAGGATGVDIFFVLSGFLITTLLLEERARTGRIQLGAFYVRRARRLIPALAVAIAAYLIATAAVGEDRVMVALLGASYVANILMAAGSTMFRESGLIHLWSLAEEEQFYLLWPVLLLAVVRIRRGLLLLVLVYLLLSVSRAELFVHGASIQRIYDGPDTRATALIAGSILALYRLQRGLLVGEWAGKVGAGALLFGALFGWAIAPWPIIGQPVFEVGIALLIAAAVNETSLASGLALGPLVWVGQRSYSLYLWQLPLGACAYVLGDGLLATGIALPLSFLCASLSYRFVEQPFRYRRHRTAALPATVTA